MLTWRRMCCSLHNRRPSQPRLPTPRLRVAGPRLPRLRPARRKNLLVWCSECHSRSPRPSDRCPRRPNPQMHRQEPVLDTAGEPISPREDSAPCHPRCPGDEAPGHDPTCQPPHITVDTSHDTATHSAGKCAADGAADLAPPNVSLGAKASDNDIELGAEAVPISPNVQAPYTPATNMHLALWPS